MTFATSTVLIATYFEEFRGGDGEAFPGEPPPIIALNQWLEADGFAPMRPLADTIEAMAPVGFMGLVFGAAHKHLDSAKFLAQVARLNWVERQDVLVLLHDEHDQGFSVYVLGSEEGAFSCIYDRRYRDRSSRAP